MKRAAGSLPTLLLSVVLAGFCLAPVSCLAMHSREASFYLEVPAVHLSVGQQFTPLLISREALTDAPLIRVELLDAASHQMWTESLPLPLPGQPARLSTLSLPHPGRYRLVATAESGPSRHAVNTVSMETAPEPSSAYGGVEAINVVGLGNGVVQYLQEHAFAVSEGLDHTNAPIVVVGDPRIEGYALASTYRRLWAQVAAGANLLLLNPPMPELAPFWPFHTHLVSASECHDDLFPAALVHMHDGAIEPRVAESAVGPVVAYDLSGESGIAAETLDAHSLARPSGNSGDSGCHAVFSFRYGHGWVTVSSLPLLQHFSDTWARVYLMNLIKTASRRVKGNAAGGLASLQAQRMKTVSDQLASGPRLAASWDAAPASTPATPWPAPAVIDGSAASCFTSPAADQQSGQSLWLSLGQPTALTSVQLDLGAPGRRPTAFLFEASPDGRHWTRLGDQSQVSAQGTASYAASGQNWQALRLRVTATLPHHPWEVCEMAPIPASPTHATASSQPVLTPHSSGAGRH